MIAILIHLIPFFVQEMTKATTQSMFNTLDLTELYQYYFTIPKMDVGTPIHLEYNSVNINHLISYNPNPSNEEQIIKDDVSREEIRNNEVILNPTTSDWNGMTTTDVVKTTRRASTDQSIFTPSKKQSNRNTMARIANFPRIKVIF